MIRNRCYLPIMDSGDYPENNPQVFRMEVEKIHTDGIETKVGRLIMVYDAALWSVFPMVQDLSGLL